MKFEIHKLGSIRCCKASVRPPCEGRLPGGKIGFAEGLTLEFEDWTGRSAPTVVCFVGARPEGFDGLADLDRDDMS